MVISGSPLPLLFGRDLQKDAERCAKKTFNELIMTRPVFSGSSGGADYVTDRNKERILMAAYGLSRRFEPVFLVQHPRTER
ncbi:hypothetical protein Trydic_g6554 [Trypoxylus dichotomus]